MLDIKSATDIKGLTEAINNEVNLEMWPNRVLSDKS